MIARQKSVSNTFVIERFMFAVAAEEYPYKLALIASDVNQVFNGPTFSLTIPDWHAMVRQNSYMGQDWDNTQAVRFR